nr:DUF6461 domain-containing protein [Kibdelosporangium sp. MJ126-NF4]CTQ94873.1 hypothetical protein [Kibdelosporangium sp. MJ126-NF4]
MTSTAHDYTWFAEQFPALREAYCITLVRGLTAEEVLHILKAEDITVVTGNDSLQQAAADAWDEHDGDPLLVGVTTVGEYALMVESNGYIGVTPEFYTPLSRGTRLVAYFRNVNADCHFCWVEDEDVKLTFEPLFPTQRHGSDPDGLADVMQQVGFDFDGGHTLHTEATFALAEHLTQVRLTPELLRSAEYMCGTVSLP